MSIQVHDMFKSIAKSYDKTNDVLSFGIHRLWRFKALHFAEVKKNFPITTLDLCCGTGDFLIATSKLSHPGSKHIGLDFVLDMLPIAVSKTKIDTDKFSYIHGDTLSLPVKDNSIDLCTIGFGIRNLDSTELGLQEMYRTLKIGGKSLILEFGTPHLPVFKQIFQLYSKYIMPFIGHVCSGNRSAYEYLPETSAAYPCREDFCRLMRNAGYQNVKYRSFFGGIAYCYVGTK